MILVALLDKVLRVVDIKTATEMLMLSDIHKPGEIIVMMTSSNGNIFRVTGHFCGEFTGPGEFLAQKPVTRSFAVFSDLSLNKRLSKQSRGWWFETQSRPLWRHYYVLTILDTATYSDLGHHWFEYWKWRCSWWQLCHDLWHRRLSLWQLPVTPMTTKSQSWQIPFFSE